MIKTFEKFEEYYMQRVSPFVKCIKSLKSKSITKDSYYKIDGYYGDPQRAMEEFGINDYLPLDCISGMVIVNDKKEKEIFKNNRTVKGYNNQFNSERVPIFFNYFKMIEGEELEMVINVNKYNL